MSIVIVSTRPDKASIRAVKASVRHVKASISLKLFRPESRYKLITLLL